MAHSVPWSNLQGQKARVVVRKLGNTGCPVEFSALGLDDQNGKGNRDPLHLSKSKNLLDSISRGPKKLH